MPDNLENETQQVRENTAAASQESTRLNDNLKSARREFNKIDLRGFAQSINKFNRVFSSQLNKNVQSALSGLVFERKSLSDTLNGFVPSVIQGLVQRSQNINPFSKITPFASGGVINSPTYFPLGGGGTGLAGERNPEAILPLARGADGALGVRASGGRAVQVTIQTPSPSAFFQSQSQLAAQMRRAIQKGMRNN